MICHPLDKGTRAQLDGLIRENTERIAMRTQRFFQAGELNLQELGAIVEAAVNLGELKAIRDHDEVARNA